MWWVPQQTHAESVAHGVDRHECHVRGLLQGGLHLSVTFTVVGQ